MRTVLVLCLLATLPGLARAQAAPAEEAEIPNPPKKYAYAFGGVALGLWVVAAATGGAALGLAATQNGDPANPMPYTQSLASNADAGKTLASTAYAFIGIAAAVTIVDAVLWYECFKKPRKGGDEKKSARARFTGAGVTF